MDEVAFGRYRLIVAARPADETPRRAVHVIEQLACAQDGAWPQGFAKNPLTKFSRRSPRPVSASAPRAAATER